MRSPDVTAVAHDIRDPWGIIDDPETARIIDWSRPVAVLMVAILHFVGGEADPGEIVAIFTVQEWGTGRPAPRRSGRDTGRCGPRALTAGGWHAGQGGCGGVAPMPL